jgi:hypothetical protein
MSRELEDLLLGVLVLLEDAPEHALRRGQVGTLVAVLGAGAVPVGLGDDDGRT